MITICKSTSTEHDYSGLIEYTSVTTNVIHFAQNVIAKPKLVSFKNGKNPEKPVEGDQKFREFSFKIKAKKQKNKKKNFFFVYTGAGSEPNSFSGISSAYSRSLTKQQTFVGTGSSSEPIG